MLLASGMGAGIAAAGGIVAVALGVLIIAGLWKVFVKAGIAGWWAIIPILNIYGILKVAGRPAWWLILFLIPCIELIIALVVFIDVAEKFGKGIGYALGLWILPFVFFVVLGFGAAEYRAHPEISA